MSERRTYFFDVDNTLIDNEAAKAELRRRLISHLGPGEAARFWTVYEEVRARTGVVNIPRVLLELAAGGGTAFPMTTAGRAGLAAVFADFPYADFLFPDSLEVLRLLKGHGQVAILSDGDPVFQTRKIWRAGLLDAVDGAVMVFADKTLHFPEAAAFYPADRYVVVDDKAAVLRQARAALGAAVTTVHLGHGPYAQTISADEAGAIDIRLGGIGELPAALDLRYNPASRGAAPIDR